MSEQEREHEPEREQRGRGTEDLKWSLADKRAPRGGVCVGLEPAEPPRQPGEFRFLAQLLLMWVEPGFPFDVCLE